jgi:hypothetical protein
MGVHTGNCQNKGNTKVLHVLIGQASGTLLKGCHTILLQEIPEFGVLLMVVENAVSGSAPESHISFQLD